MQDPFSACECEKPSINPTIAARLEPFKPDAFVGADKISTQHLKLFVVETRKVVFVHLGTHSMTGC
ncbi:hypothetical protein D3C86_1260880 [compost metagenome]